MTKQRNNRAAKRAAAGFVTALEPLADKGWEDALQELINSVPAVKRLLVQGRDRGFVSRDEINATLSEDEISSEVIDELTAMFEEMGVSTGGGEESSPSAVMRLLDQARDRGFVTSDEMNAALAEDGVSHGVVDELIAIFEDMGVKVGDAEANNPADKDMERDESPGRANATARTYLRQKDTFDLEIAGAMRPIHPGEILRDELAELGLSARAFAMALDIPVNRVTQIMREQRGVSADTALRLARYFGMSPEFWMGLQSDYELRRAQRDMGHVIAQAVRPRAA